MDPESIKFVDSLFVEDETERAKRIKRTLRNREAARQSRERKRNEIINLKRENARLFAENRVLKEYLKKKFGLNCAAIIQVDNAGTGKAVAIYDSSSGQAPGKAFVVLE